MLATTGWLLAALAHLEVRRRWQERGHRLNPFDLQRSEVEAHGVVAGELERHRHSSRDGHGAFWFVKGREGAEVFLERTRIICRSFLPCCW